MAQLGIRSGLDLRAQSQAFPQQHFGKAGFHYYWAARGVDERLVRTDRIRKSVGENASPADLSTYEAARDEPRQIVDKVGAHCDRSSMRGRTVTLKLKFAGTAPIVPRQALLQYESRPGYICALFANGLEARAGWAPQGHIAPATLSVDPAPPLSLRVGIWRQDHNKIALTRVGDPAERE
jgi:nucleotidyltransferase/DNA polymerase involved in DNA repair